AAVSSRASPRTIRAMRNSERILGSKPSDEPTLTISINGARSVVPVSSITAVAWAACESMQKKQSFTADTAVASISRSTRSIDAPGKSLTSSSSARPRRWTPSSGVSRIAAPIPGTSGRPPTIGSSRARSSRSSSRAIDHISHRTSLHTKYAVPSLWAQLAAFRGAGWQVPDDHPSVACRRSHGEDSIEWRRLSVEQRASRVVGLTRDGAGRHEADAAARLDAEGRDDDDAHVVEVVVLEDRAAAGLRL